MTLLGVVTAEEVAIILGAAGVLFGAVAASLVKIVNEVRKVYRNTNGQLDPSGQSMSVADLAARTASSLADLHARIDQLEERHEETVAEARTARTKLFTRFDQLAKMMEDRT